MVDFSNGLSHSVKDHPNPSPSVYDQKEALQMTFFIFRLVLVFKKY